MSGEWVRVCKPDAFVLLTVGILGWGELCFRGDVDREAQLLESVAAEVAAHVDSSGHESIDGPGRASTATTTAAGSAVGASTS